MKFYCYIFCLLICTPLSGQRRIDPSLDPRNYRGGFVLVRENELCVKSSDISNYQVLDTASVVIMYRKIYRPDANSELTLEEPMMLQVGSCVSSFFSYKLFQMDSVYTASDFQPWAGSVGRVDPYIILRMKQEERLRVIIRMPFQSNAGFVYDEKIPETNWSVRTDTTKIMQGYTCVLAEGECGGRKWIVWFTPEVPLDAGPWKLSGLPGLIMQAHDANKEYIFELTALLNKRDKICQYGWRLKKMLKAEWQKMEREMYKSPWRFVNQGNQVLFLSGKASGRLDESNWKNVPYNPIELE